jgi:hypothetical protein
VLFSRLVFDDAGAGVGTELTEDGVGAEGDGEDDAVAEAAAPRAALAEPEEPEEVHGGWLDGDDIEEF